MWRPILLYIISICSPRYFKTTLSGITSLTPDYCLVCVSAVRGLQSMTVEHVGIGLYLQVRRWMHVQTHTHTNAYTTHIHTYPNPPFMSRPSSPP
ncbi:hypothetical protein EON65_29010 [archaeon]|nr:MAG: hypothetical protein EON65_29010 [archaeon]